MYRAFKKSIPDDIPFQVQVFISRHTKSGINTIFKFLDLFN